MARRGWTWPSGAKVMHYIINHRSYCKRWRKNGEFEARPVDPRFCCKVCTTRIFQQYNLGLIPVADLPTLGRPGPRMMAPPRF